MQKWPFSFLVTTRFKKMRKNLRIKVNQVVTKIEEIRVENSKTDIPDFEPRSDQSASARKLNDSIRSTEFTLMVFLGQLSNPKLHSIFSHVFYLCEKSEKMKIKKSTTRFKKMPKNRRFPIKIKKTRISQSHRKIRHLFEPSCDYFWKKNIPQAVSGMLVYLRGWGVRNGIFLSKFIR